MKKHHFTKIAALLPVFFLTLVFTSSCGGSSDSREATATDTVAAANDEKSLADATLRQRCKVAKASFPLKVDQVTTQTDVQLTPKEIVHLFTIDEDALGVTLNSDKVSPDALYGSIIESLKLNLQDSTMRQEMAALVTTGRGIVYHYTGSKSGAEIEVKVTPEKLGEVMK